MFKKITIFLFFSIIPFHVFSAPSEGEIPKKPIIIPRASWGANELYTSIESEYWKTILKKQKEHIDIELSNELKKKKKEDHDKVFQYINENFAEQNKITQKVLYDPQDGFKLAWPLKYTDYVNAIVIHHTSQEYESNIEGMKDIYRYHSLNKAWGDIGYNYVIGYDGTIFEGKKGGDYISAAHSKWNNNSTVGISVMGNYENKPINQEQYQSLESLVRYLAWKYGIDFSKKYYYNMDCAGEKCNTFPLETRLDSTLVGHKDTGHTSGPGKSLYEQIQKLRKDNINFTAGFQRKKRKTTTIQKESNTKASKIQKILRLLNGYTQEELKYIYIRINSLLGNKNISHERRKKLQILRLGVILSQKKKS